MRMDLDPQAVGKRSGAMISRPLARPGVLPVIRTAPERGSTATELGCCTVGTPPNVRGFDASETSITRSTFDAVNVT